MLYDAGVFGLGVMGRSLALNFASRGKKIAAYNRPEDGFAAAFRPVGEAAGLLVTDNLPQWLAVLRKPRLIFLMVTAGKAVDGVLDMLCPLLEVGDCVIDGGNSYWKDTRRRCEALSEKGLYYLGCGVSGGEAGALRGPAMMIGGDFAAWKLAEDLLVPAAAKAADGIPCCGYMGSDGAGHFVKMVHNGIEYADMAFLCEAYDLLRHAGLSAEAVADVLADWNRGRLHSYLTEISATILRRRDTESGRPLVDCILDTAGQKGTGCWTAQEALGLGVAAPTIGEAVFSRCLSAAKSRRVAASKVLPGGSVIASETLVRDLEQAVYCGRLTAYAQGFDLLEQASREQGWNLPLPEIARIWRQGCILRSSLLEPIATALEQPSPGGLLTADSFAGELATAQSGWRRTAAFAVTSGVPLPCILSALAYYDGLRAENGPANLLQAQRDYFGAHTYRRLDREGAFHTQWEEV